MSTISRRTPWSFRSRIAASRPLAKLWPTAPGKVATLIRPVSDASIRWDRLRGSIIGGRSFAARFGTSMARLREGMNILIGHFLGDEAVEQARGELGIFGLFGNEGSRGLNRKQIEFLRGCAVVQP